MKIVNIVVITFIFCKSSFSQNCFKRLGDLNGFLDANTISQLNTKSCELIDSLPTRFTSNFGIFDFGFYPLNKFMPGEFSKEWENIKSLSTDSMPYYLLIGREASISGTYNKIHIDLKFPKTNEFDCVTDEQIAYLRFQIEKEVNKIKDKSVLEIETLAIEMLSDFIILKLECCSLGNRSMCAGECFDHDEFTNYLDDNDFYLTEVNTLTKVNYTNITANVKEYAKLSFYKGDSLFDVNEDIKDLVNEITGFADNVLAEIYYYEGNCKESFNLVEEKHFDEADGTYFHIKVIGVNSLLGDKISIKVESNLYQGKGSGTLFVLNLNSGYDTEKIINSAQYFFDLAGLKIKLKAITKLEPIGDRDGIAVIGNNKKKVGKFVFGNDILLTALNAIEPCKLNNTVNDLKSWYLEPLPKNPEQAGNKVMMLATSDMTDFFTLWNNSNNDNKLSGSNGIYRLIGYNILHATSHNAGFWHPKIQVITNERTGLGYEIWGKGYANSGDEHVCYLTSCPYHQNLEERNFESIIKWTKQEYKYIITQTNVRYGY